MCAVFGPKSCHGHLPFRAIINTNYQPSKLQQTVQHWAWHFFGRPNIHLSLYCNNYNSTVITTQHHLPDTYLQLFWLQNTCASTESNFGWKVIMVLLLFEYLLHSHIKPSNYNMSEVFTPLNNNSYVTKMEWKWLKEIYNFSQQLCIFPN